MKKTTKVACDSFYEPSKVILMTVIVAVLTVVVFASIGLMATA